jgi:DNA polymerase kappa
VRKVILEKTQLTASCGVAANRLLAKVCADFNKPDAQTFLKPDIPSILTFMADLPVRKIPGVGKVNEMILAGLQIFTCRDLVQKASALNLNFTERAFDFLLKSALGVGKN